MHLGTIEALRREVKKLQGFVQNQSSRQNNLEEQVLL
jgi:hypothetical protein